MRLKTIFTPRNTTEERMILLPENDYMWAALLPSEGRLMITDEARNIEVCLDIRFEEGYKERERDLQRGFFDAIERVQPYRETAYLTSLGDVAYVMARAPYVMATTLASNGKARFMTTSHYRLDVYTLLLLVDCLYSGTFSV